MSLERLKERLEQIQNRIPMVKGRGEEATKQALVLPLLDALGYDIWNPGEVCPEYDADFAVKKQGQKERVDLAVLLNDVPRVYFEVKAIDTALDGHEGQLARYFNSTKTVSLAVLTNGVEYRFFTDSGEPNILDGRPFHTMRLDALEQSVDVLSRFHKALFSPEAVRDFATEIQYTAKMVTTLRSELDLRNREPSDFFMRWLLSSEGMYEGRVTAGVVERFRPIAKNALQIVIRDIVRRSVAAIDEGVLAPEAPAVPDPPAAPAVIPSIEAPKEEENKSKIVTTEAELSAFQIVKDQLLTSALANGTIFDATVQKQVPIELGYKDTTGYFGIYFNKPGWWVLRLNLDGKAQWVGFNIKPEKVAELLPTGFSLLPGTGLAEVRVSIKGPNDLHALNRLIFATMAQAVEDRKPAGG
jgi:predicted type IV restriction endonuclease